MCTANQRTHSTPLRVAHGHDKDYGHARAMAWAAGTARAIDMGPGQRHVPIAMPIAHGHDHGHGYANAHTLSSGLHSKNMGKASTDMGRLRRWAGRWQ